MIRTVDLFDLKHTLSADYLYQYDYPWLALSGIKSMIINLGKNLDKTQYREIYPQIWVHKSAKLSQSSFINAPCIIGEGTQIRHCALIRGSALIGKNCVIGNSTEIKNSIVFDEVQIPHYNYVGDSIFGYKAHMGAGSVTSNVKSDKSQVTINSSAEKIPTNLKKCGAFIGDYVEIGCNCVLNPGTIIGRNTNIYPLLSVRGIIPSESILKSNDSAIPKETR